MALEERELPLFPLNTVLFPASYMPLQIFEERYKLMLQHCLESDSTFGVALIKSGKEVGEPAEPYQIGTTAKIVQTSPVSGGRIFVSVFGQQRFSIQEILQRKPYIKARVKILAEGLRDDVSPQLAAEVRSRLLEYLRTLETLRGGWVRDMALPDDALSLSYFIGGILDLQPLEKQKLLEAHPLAHRLLLESEAIAQEIEVLKQTAPNPHGFQRFSRN